ncbi:MAG TPA: UDP-3-O-(3-hydroxymyristoyl)glucosamine N-acyltransferase [Flavipsychrobacter sp.]|nr:UDP-3-O-(3-hydroxymyristoyl)glucosamine N-acyltransferase [Flavipsychrobacter sp.]
MISIKKILNDIDYLEYVGDTDASVKAPVQLDVNNSDPTLLMWVNNKNIHLLHEVGMGIIICDDTFKDFKNTCNYIITKTPRLLFKQILELFFLPKPRTGVAESAKIAQGVSIGKDVFIGEHVVVEEGCSIGDNTSIYHNTVILANTQIGNNVKIGSNNTIGGVGFGYEKDVDSEYSLIPHLGNVVIKDQVEIGNNTCIDRAVLGSTIIHKNAKIDNLVHIAHGVEIGDNSLIIANAMIGGSTIIGNNVWFAPSASVLNKKHIADDAVIGMAAVVVKDVQKGETIVGNPGKPLNKK